MRRMDRTTIHDEQSVGLVEQIMSQMYTRQLGVPVLLTTGNQGAEAASVDICGNLGDELLTTWTGAISNSYMINGIVYQISTMATINDICVNLPNLSTPHHALYELGTDATTNTPVTAAAFAAGSGGLVGSVCAPFQYVLFTLLTSGSGWAYAGEPAVSTGAAEIPPCPEDECPISCLLLNVRNMSTGAAGPTIKYDWTHDLSSHAITQDVIDTEGAMNEANGSFSAGLPVSFYTKAVTAYTPASLTVRSH